MKSALVIAIFFCGQFALAQIPKGIWLADQFVQDDGAYGKYYKSWLVIGETAVDQITTLGMHYDKVKYIIVSDKDGTLETLDPVENRRVSFSYEGRGPRLQFCTSLGNCQSFQKTNEKPPTDEAPHSYPPIQLSAKWCVDSECFTTVYSGIQSEMLYNLNSGFKSAFWRFEGPQEFFERYGVRLNINSYSYRFSNDTSQLSSFSTNLYFISDEPSQFRRLATSGVVSLHDGSLAKMEALYLDKNFSVEFFISSQTK